MPLRAAIIADSHYDETKRFEECQRLHGWIAEDAARRGVGLTLHAGDLHERKTTPLERAASFPWVQRMARLGPFVIVRGNHDAVDDLPLLALLDSEHPITVVEKYAVVEVAGALVACLAWPRKAELLAVTGAESHEAVEALAAEALRNVLRGMGDEMQGHTGPTMLLMHAMVRDSKTSTGQPLVGAEMEISLLDLALARAGAYFLGHVHFPQHWQIDGAWAGYPGSPRRTNFGEVEPKGYLIADFDDEGRCVVQFVEAPATPMLLLENDWSPDGWIAAMSGPCDGCEIRFRYRVAQDHRHAARTAAEQFRAACLARGAITVQLDEQVILEQRTRAEAIVTAAPLDQQVEAYWKAKGFDPGERRGPLLAKVRTIEEGSDDVSAA